MTNINNELSELFGETFYKVSKNVNEYIPIIKNSNSIAKIIPHFFNINKDKKESLNQLNDLLNLLNKYFKQNTNLIPLFLNNSIYNSGKTFYECLIILYLKDYLNEENKKVIEEIMKNININYPLSKSIIEFIYQNLSQYFTNEAKSPLTSNLLNRYLNLLNLMYSNTSSISQSKTKKIVTNYIYFNGINSGLSLMINKYSSKNCNTFPTLEKGFSFVFWIKFDSKLINDYFKILNGKTNINLIKINIGGELLTVKLVNPKTINISTKGYSTPNIDIEKLFKYNDWNSIIFTAEKKKNKLLTKLYINNNQIDIDIKCDNKMNWKEKINNIDLFENFLGQVSSIIFFSFIIDYNFISYFSSINGFYKNKILREFLISSNKDYFDINNIDKKIQKPNTKLNIKLKLKLKEQNINNLIFCFCPFTFDKSKNTIDDVFGNFIGKLSNNDGVIFYKKINKNIQSLGGINNLLPIMELMFCSLKKDNPYKLVDNNIFTEKNFEEILIIIQKVLSSDIMNTSDEKETKFLSSLIIFFEKIPTRFYTHNILGNILNLSNIAMEKERFYKNKNSINFLDLILLNERIITKFEFNLQIELWNNLYYILTKDMNKIKISLNTPKVCLFIRYYDEERYSKFCCKKHASILNIEINEANKRIIMEPELNLRIKKLFEIIKYYIDKSSEDNNLKDIFKLITLDLSPCVQNKIIELYISHFLNKKVDREIKKKTLSILLKNKFVEICEYILKISLLDTRVLIFQLFNIIITDYKNETYDFFKRNSIVISEIIGFFSLNILPNNLILEVDKVDEILLKNKTNIAFINKSRIKEINKGIYENFFCDNKNYVYLIDLFNKNEYNKNIEDIWNFFFSSFKYTPKELLTENIKEKNKKSLINPFTFNILIYFVSSISSYLPQFLVEVFSNLHDDSIVNRNIFYKNKDFFPWLIDTIFYFYNKQVPDLINNEALNTIKCMSIKIFCELFSHRREKNETSDKLRYIMEYLYYCKIILKRKNIKELLEIARMLFLKICEFPEVHSDIKYKLIFEFMILFNNSENIIKEQNFDFVEINTYNNNEFFENNEIEGESNDNNNIIIIENNKNNENMNNIEDINENEIQLKINDISSEKMKDSIKIGKNDLIPNFFYEGINYISENQINKGEKLENIWSDYKLFIHINKYFKSKLWGLENLCKNSKKNKNKLEDDSKFKKIVKELFKIYGDTKENKNIFIKKILNCVGLEKQNEKSLNILYINIILLSMAIDISENEEEKNNLYFDYQQLILFFVLASINLNPNEEFKDKSNNKINSIIEKFLYNIIGYGFLFIKKRDSQMYEKFKENIILPIFEKDQKIIFGYSKKSFFRDSIIGKLFTLKDMESNDDIGLGRSMKKGTQIKSHIRAATDMNRSVMILGHETSGKLTLEKKLESSEDIILKANSSTIIKEVIEETVKNIKYERTILSRNNILFFYQHINSEEENKKSKIYKNHKRIEEIEKNIGKRITNIIKDLNNEIKHYWNKSCLLQLIRRRDYKKTKKLLFSWNGFWSNRNLFYKHPEYLKLHIKNHFTRDMTKILLTPILDIDYYLPDFKSFDKKKLFNVDDHKYMIKLNIDEILKLDEINLIDEKLENDNIKENIIKKEGNKNGIKTDEKIKIIRDNAQNKNNNKIIIKDNIKENDEKNIQNKNNKTKNIFYLKSNYKYAINGLLEQYQNFYNGKINSENLVLGAKDTFDFLIQSKLMFSETMSQYENIYNCCIVKPTHHIKGYISTEKVSAKFTHCYEDEESQKLLYNDFTYDKELHCCFGSTFKRHLKDMEKVCLEIEYDDIKYILPRNYFYQETAIEIYTFSNKSYFLNFKTKKEMQKFRDDILNHDTFVSIIGRDFKNEKIVGYKKSKNPKTKLFKVIEIMNDWKNNKISTLKYLMYINIFSGRSFNDLTQYPVLPWIITNYNKEELTKDDIRDLSIPVGMIAVSDKAIKRKEIFLEFYDTLKNEFKENNGEFNYKEYLNKGGEYLELYQTKMKKNKTEEEKNDDLGKIQINQIPFFYGTHYSCPTFVSHFLMRVFPFSLVSIEIQGNKFDDPDRIFISMERTFESASTLKEDIRELIPEFYTLPEMFLNKNNLNLTQNKLDSEGKAIIVNDVELPLWCNNLSFNFISELRKNLEKNDLKINKWIDLIFGYLQRGEKAEENHNIFMAQSYENIVKIDKIIDEDERNSLMRLVEVGMTPKQIFRKETTQKNERNQRNWKYIYESKKLFVFSIIIPKYDDLVKKLNENKSINKENKESIYPKIIKLKCIDSKELLLINEYNNIIRFKYKSNLDKHIIENKEMFQVQNISSEYSPSYTISSKDTPIVLYNNNKYMIKAGFWDGRIEMNSLVLDQKEKTYAKKNYYVKEGPVLLMEITKDEKILICGTKTGCLICFSIEKFSLNLIKKLYSHSDEITSININDNLNMFATSSLDGYINLHILPNFELVRSIKICNTNINSYNENDSEFYYANNVFLSSSPVACVTVFISSKRIFRSFTINGEFIEEIQETNNLNYIKCPIIFNDLDFQDYIIYGTDDGTIKIRKFPHLELINSVCPKEGNEIISMDISKDNNYCYIWLNNNEIFVIKDLYVDSEKDKKRISKIDKEMEQVKEDSD